jgi:hypothetical protein
MNSMCHFDGGDCLTAQGWYTHLEQQMAALDTDRNQLVSQSEFEHPTATAWTSDYEDVAGSFLFHASASSGCGATDEGLGRKHLALAAFVPCFPSPQAQKTLSRNHDTHDTCFNLVPHAHLDPLRTALYVMGWADVDVDGAMSFEEARQSYRLNWHEFTFLHALADHPGTAVEAQEIASVLELVVRTLRGEPWPDRDTFYGVSVSMCLCLCLCLSVSVSVSVYVCMYVYILL